MPKVSDKTFTVRLPNELYKLVDAYAFEEHRSRNSAIIHLLSLALNKSRAASYDPAFRDDNMMMPSPEEYQRCMEAYSNWFDAIFKNRGSFGAQNKTKFEEYCFAVAHARPENMTLYQWKVLHNTIVKRKEALGGFENLAIEIDAIYSGAKPAAPILPTDEPTEPAKPPSEQSVGQTTPAAPTSLKSPFPPQIDPSPDAVQEPTGSKKPLTLPEFMPPGLKPSDR
jgi:hypothetical protein